MSLSALLNEYGGMYLRALLNTWRLTAICFTGAFIIGVLVTVLRVCPVKPLRAFGDFYVQMFRNIPGAAMLIIAIAFITRFKVKKPGMKTMLSFIGIGVLEFIWLLYKTKTK